MKGLLADENIFVSHTGIGGLFYVPAVG